MLCLGVIILIAGASLALPSSTVDIIDLDNAPQLFEQFIVDYEREYRTEEEKSMRLEIFKKTLKIINELNMKSDSAIFGITEFSDYTEEERLRMTPCIHMDGDIGDGECQQGVISIHETELPAAFDWRDKKVVSPVKNQGQCGSCWAFSAVGNVESAYARKHDNTILDLSEQELVDCDDKSSGCGGASAIEAGLSAFLRLGGAESEADYPYKAVNQKCAFDKTKVKVKLASCKIFSITKADDIKAALVANGPLSIGVDASTDAWQNYKSGVLDCPDSDAIDHAVLLVGYGTEKGKDFWIIKNSWGTTWGEKGYIRVNQKHDCNLSKVPMASSEVA